MFGHGLKNVIIYNNKIARIDKDIFELYAAYRQDGKIYFKNKGQETSNLATHDQKNSYLAILFEVMPEITDPFIINSTSTWFPQIKRSMLFHKIEGEIDIDLLVRLLKQHIRENAVFWAKEITCISERLRKRDYIDIPGLDSQGNPYIKITLQDVIIDDKDNIFFTYEGKFYSQKAEIKEDYKKKYQDKFAKTVS